MNIRSIDLQVLIPQATEVSKTQHTANQQSAAQQQQFAAQWQRIAENRQQQVQVVNQSEGKRIKEQKESPNKQSSQEQESEQKQQDRQDNATNHAVTSTHADPIRGHVIDIKT